MNGLRSLRKRSYDVVEQLYLLQHVSTIGIRAEREA